MEVIDVAFHGEFFELLEEVTLVRDDFFFLSLVILETVVKSVWIRNVVDGHWTLIELFLSHGVK